MEKMKYSELVKACYILDTKTERRFGSAISIQRWFEAMGLDGDNKAKRYWLLQLLNGNIIGHILTSDRSSNDRIATSNPHLFVDDPENPMHIPVNINRGVK